MRSRTVGAVVVVDPDGEGAGILTERDVLVALAEGADPDVETVSLAPDHRDRVRRAGLVARAGGRGDAARRLPAPGGARRRRGRRDPVGARHRPAVAHRADHADQLGPAGSCTSRRRLRPVVAEHRRQDRGERHRDHGTDQPGQHAARGDRHDDAERVQPDQAAHHQRLQQVALHLLDHDDRGQHEDRGHDRPASASATTTATKPLTNAPTIGTNAPKNTSAASGTASGTRRIRQREPDADRVHERDEHGPADVRREHQPAALPDLVHAVLAAAREQRDAPAPRWPRRPAA